MEAAGLELVRESMNGGEWELIKVQNTSVPTVGIEDCVLTLISSKIN
jgi:hypothetical protein